MASEMLLGDVAEWRKRRWGAVHAYAWHQEYKLALAQLDQKAAVMSTCTHHYHPVHTLVKDIAFSDGCTETYHCSCLDDLDPV